MDGATNAVVDEAPIIIGLDLHLRGDELSRNHGDADGDS
jgi:hypothetical protein